MNIQVNGRRWSYELSPDEIADVLRADAESARCLQGRLDAAEAEPEISVRLESRNGAPWAIVSSEHDPARDGTAHDCIDAILGKWPNGNEANTLRAIFADGAVRAALDRWIAACHSRTLAVHPDELRSLVCASSGGLREPRRSAAEIADALVAALAKSVDRGTPKHWCRWFHETLRG